MTVIGTDSATAVFPFRLYDISRDEFVVSKRLATANAIAQLGAIQAGPSFSVAPEDVDDFGLTEIGYDGYKRQVR